MSSKATMCEKNLVRCSFLTLCLQEPEFGCIRLDKALILYQITNFREFVQGLWIDKVRDRATG
jgi:hypothetical protein